MATIDERIMQGEKAKQVLENEAFILAFETIKQELIQAWESSPARDEEGREKIFLSLQVTKKLKSTLTAMLETGKLAMAERMHKQSLLDRAKEMSPFSESY